MEEIPSAAVRRSRTGRSSTRTCGSASASSSSAFSGATGAMEFNPEPETAIRAGDKLVVLGRPESLKRLEAEA